MHSLLVHAGKSGRVELYISPSEVRICFFLFSLSEFVGFCCGAREARCAVYSSEIPIYNPSSKEIVPCFGGQH
jgi:hypothetical protein